MRGDRHTYVPAFDGLRGIAILPVVLLHVGVQTLPSGRLLYELTRGWYGVDLFFVLSGFLITWILLAEIEATGTITLTRFYERRFLRLGPAYASMLVAALVGAAIFQPEVLTKVPFAIPALVTYTYNYQIATGGTHFAVLTVVWSLCVEEQFYLLWPFILRCLDAKRALWFCLGAIAVLATYRTGLYTLLNWRHLGQPSPASSIWIYFATGTRIGVILIGCAAALSLRNPRARGLWRWMRRSRFFPTLAMVAACACVVFVTGGRPSSASWRSATFGYTLAGFAVAALIAAIFSQPASIIARTLSCRPLVSLGRISYGVYLFHPLIAWLVLRMVPFSLWPGAIARFTMASLVVMFFTWIAAAIHYRYIERWFMSHRPPAAGRAQLPGREQRLPRTHVFRRDLKDSATAFSD